MVYCDIISLSTAASPAGGAGADVVSWEAEGQQGTEQPPVVEKFGKVGRNSLDIFSPAREGQTLPPKSVLLDALYVKVTKHDLFVKKSPAAAQSRDQDSCCHY